MHVELFLEEPSAEAFMQGFLPKVLRDDSTWNPIVFQGKSDLPRNLESRLKASKKWIPEDYRIVVLIDEDRADCRKLKSQMEEAAKSAGFLTTTAALGERFLVLNRIVVEELEAWYIGDPEAIRRLLRAPTRAYQRGWDRNRNFVIQMRLSVEPGRRLRGCCNARATSRVGCPRSNSRERWRYTWIPGATIHGAFSSSLPA